MVRPSPRGTLRPSPTATPYRCWCSRTRGSIPVATREEVEAAFQGAAHGYHAQGLVGARPTIVGSEAITERLVSADVRWDYLDEQGRSAQQDGYRYVLRLEDETDPKIQVVIATPLE
jgi:hypothetical protein